MNIKKKERRGISLREHKQDNFYNTKAWKTIRKVALDRDNHLCQECLKSGIINPGNTVDHVIPIKRGGGRLDINNLRTLCRNCHDKKSGSERRK